MFTFDFISQDIAGYGIDIEFIFDVAYRTFYFIRRMEGHHRLVRFGGCRRTGRCVRCCCPVRAGSIGRRHHLLHGGTGLALLRRIAGRLLALFILFILFIFAVPVLVLIFIFLIFIMAVAVMAVFIFQGDFLELDRRFILADSLRYSCPDLFFR